MYAKVYRSLWEGTLAGTGEVWAVFVFLLAHCDREGFVDVHPKVISTLSGFDEERVRHALLTLEGPDHESRTAAEDGARIVRIDEHRDWGWQIVNYSRYRQLVDAEVRRAQVRDAVRRHREKKASVSVSNHPKSQVDVEAEAENLTLAPPAPATEPSKASQTRDWKQAFAEHFWPAYVKHRSDGKQAAFLVWMRIEPKTEEHLNQILDGLEDQAKKWRSENTEQRFIQHARTWLYQKRWLDFERSL